MLVGRKGTIASYDYEKTIRVQTPDHPAGRDLAVDQLQFPNRGAIEYVLDCLENGRPAPRIGLVDV